MSSAINSRSIGCESSSDLVLQHPGISRHHASLELADDGLVSLVDMGSSNGTFLNRNDSWIQLKKITLCIGDRVRFGELEVPLQRLTAVFGDGSNARLEARHFTLKPANKSVRAFSDLAGPGPVLKKPMRNAVTGKIEERDD